MRRMKYKKTLINFGRIIGRAMSMSKAVLDKPLILQQDTTYYIEISTENVKNITGEKVGNGFFSTIIHTPKIYDIHKIYECYFPFAISIFPGYIYENKKTLTFYNNFFVETGNRLVNETQEILEFGNSDDLYDGAIIKFYKLD